MTSPSEDSLTVSGAWYGWRLPTLAVAFLGGLVALGSVLALERLHLPWMLPGSLVEHPVVAPMAFVFAAGFAAGLVKPFFMARAGTVTLSAEGVQWRGRFRSFTAWSEIEAYSDALPMTVRLVRRGKSVPSHKLGLPTRGEEARVQVLCFLDARGLRRVEVPPREIRLWRGIATGLLAVAVVILPWYRVNEPYWRLLDLETGVVTPSAEDKAFLSRYLPVRFALRPKVGSADPFVITGERDFDFPEGMLVVPRAHALPAIMCRAEAEGREIGTARAGRSPDTIFGQPRSGLAVFAWAHNLTPGRQSIRVVANVSLGRVNFEKATDLTVEVIPGSIVAETIRLVPGPAPPLEARAQVTPGNVLPFFSCKHLEHALAMDVAVLESGTCIYEGAAMVEPKGPLETGYLSDGALLVGPNLPHGRHVLVFRFTPAPKWAFATTVDITEIYGEPFEKELVVDVP